MTDSQDDRGTKFSTAEKEKFIRDKKIAAEAFDKNFGYDFLKYASVGVHHILPFMLTCLFSQCGLGLDLLDSDGCSTWSRLLLTTTAHLSRP